MSAAFNTPIAGVILAIELLLFEFRSRSFIPLVIASTFGNGRDVVPSFGIRDEHNTGAIPRAFSGGGGRHII
ncbi:MAG: chloride channel protein [Candidatus Sulfotelmatobacter sp.]